MDSNKYVPSSHQQAVACFVSLINMGYPIAYARAIARAFFPPVRLSVCVVVVAEYERPQYDRINQAPGTAKGLLASLGYDSAANGRN